MKYDSKPEAANVCQNSVLYVLSPDHCSQLGYNLNQKSGSTFTFQNLSSNNPTNHTKNRDMAHLSKREEINRKAAQQSKNNGCAKF